MDGQAEPEDGQAGTLPLFGRRLRRHFGDTIAGLDDAMILLLEKLRDVPGVAEGAFSKPT
ncbi:MAG TPA: hypothetical protein VGC10_01995 [Sphingomonas sp.]